MLIHVTQADIEHGTAKDCTDCPIARALQTVSINTVECKVTQSYAYAVDKLNENQIVWETYLPTPATDFIRKFDRNEMVKPFNFDLEIPEKYLC